ncbi:hypothetical protein [Reyranella soli]|uniref:Secreted protein n=1 Tax=Reyranella soli TaxID=1230389 RepID=A0A512NL36_9HYPH|nr:hypothetical protein [Reyranella soli]GEP59666.1 hypothetical protein RSO01_68320 [Reyranella soli]
MTRMFFVSAFLVASAISLGVSNAQSPPAAKCGPVAYDQASQTYVGIPCNSAATPEAPAGKTASSGTATTQKCGPVTYDQATQTYVSLPCVAGTTEENPAGRSQ